MQTNRPSRHAEPNGVGGRIVAGIVILAIVIVLGTFLYTAVNLGSSAIENISAIREAEERRSLYQVRPTQTNSHLSGERSDDAERKHCEMEEGYMGQQVVVCD